MVPGPRAVRDNKALAQFSGVSNTQNSFVAISAGLVSLLGRPEIEGMCILSSGYPISRNINDSGDIRHWCRVERVVAIWVQRKGTTLRVTELQVIHCSL